MFKDDRKYLIPFESPEAPAGLFDRIILAIKREQELHNTKQLTFRFLALLTISLTAAPFSWTFFSQEISQSGTLYFISTALGDFQTFLVFWQDFGLAIIESLPIAGLIVLIFNITLAVFTIRLFLHKKMALFNYAVLYKNL